MPDDDLIDTAETMSLLGVDRSTVTRMAADGRLKPVRRVGRSGIGGLGAFLFARSEVEAMASERTTERSA